MKVRSLTISGWGKTFPAKTITHPSYVWTHTCHSFEEQQNYSNHSSVYQQPTPPVLHTLPEGTCPATNPTGQQPQPSWPLGKGWLSGVSCAPQLPPVTQADVHFEVSYEMYGVFTMHSCRIYYGHAIPWAHGPVLSRCTWNARVASPTRRMAADGSSTPMSELTWVKWLDMYQKHWYSLRSNKESMLTP